jgi:hypothetical protein
MIEEAEVRRALEVILIDGKQRQRRILRRDGSGEDPSCAVL